ncbi:MAG: hypothetical protein WBG69_06820 [Arcobacteraceae bacterium]
MVLKKTAIACIAIMLSLSLNANANEDLEKNVEQNTEVVDNCEKEYSMCLEKCDQDGTNDAEACYDACDLKLTDCENKAKSE